MKRVPLGWQISLKGDQNADECRNLINELDDLRRDIKWVRSIVRSCVEQKRRKKKHASLLRAAKDTLQVCERAYERIYAELETLKLQQFNARRTAFCGEGAK